MGEIGGATFPIRLSEVRRPQMPVRLSRLWEQALSLSIEEREALADF